MIFMIPVLSVATIFILTFCFGDMEDRIKLGRIAKLIFVLIVIANMFVAREIMKSDTDASLTLTKQIQEILDIEEVVIYKEVDPETFMVRAENILYEAKMIGGEVVSVLQGDAFVYLQEKE